MAFYSGNPLIFLTETVLMGKEYSSNNTLLTNSGPRYDTSFFGAPHLECRTLHCSYSDDDIGLQMDNKEKAFMDPTLLN